MKIVRSVRAGSLLVIAWVTSIGFAAAAMAQFRLDTTAIRPETQEISRRLAQICGAQINESLAQVADPGYRNEWSINVSRTIADISTEVSVHATEQLARQVEISQTNRSNSFDPSSIAANTMWSCLYSAARNMVGGTSAAPSATARSAVALFNAGNREDAIRQWRELADRGDRDAAYYLAAVFAGGAPGIARDPALADRYYAVAANAGLPKAQANYGLFLLQTGRRDEGLQWVERAARSGDAEAQWILASGYWRGRGVERDLPRALALMRLSAAQNFAFAVRDRPLIEASLAAEPQAQAAAPPANESPAANMIPEVAAAWRAATDPEVRARIARNAAAYAASRPSLVVRANSGTGCIRPEMVNYRFEPPVNGASEVWLADIRLTNSCNSEQFAYAEERMPNGRLAGMPITNVGRFPGRWDRRRDPAVGFRPWNPEGESPRYRLRAGAEWSGDGIYRGGGSNQVELWIGSCPSHGPGNVTQIGFRPTAYMRDDPRIACVPGVQGPDRY